MISSLGIQTNLVSSAGPALWELRPPAGTRPRVLSIEFCCSQNGPGTIQLAYATVSGVNPTKNYFLSEDMPGTPSMIWAAVAWNTPPVLLTTIPAGFIASTYIRRFPFNNTTANQQGVIWTFPRGLTVPAGSSLCIWSLTSVAASIVNCVIEE